MTAPQQPQSDFHTGEQYTNSITSYQGTPQYIPPISPVGQDSFCYQHIVAPPYKPYMPRGQNYTDSDQTCTARVQNYRAQALYMDQAQHHLAQTQSYVSAGLGVPAPPQGRNKKGGGSGQRHHRSNAGKQYSTQSQNAPEHHSNSNRSLFSPYVPEEYQGNGLLSQNRLSFFPLDTTRIETQSSGSMGFQGTDKPDNKSLSLYNPVDFQGEGVQHGSSEGGVELSSVGPSNSNESEKSIHSSDPFTVGTSLSNTPETYRVSAKLKIDPIRGPPPAFLPGNTAVRNISLRSSPGGGVNRQISYSKSDSVSGLCVIEKTPSNMGYQPANGSVNSGPLVMAPTPKRSVSHVVYGASSVTGSPLSTIQPSCGYITPIKLQPPRRIWPSLHMCQISPGGAKPSLEVAFDPQNLPFMELGRRSSAIDNGVIRISNVPYHITRAEIVAFLGRNARTINESDEPIHIIMERVTSKTMDAYVEFINISEAVNAVNRYEQNRALGRPGRLGERHVEIEVSSQSQLMADLFPKARNVKWHGSRPEIIPVPQNDPYNSGFQGFLSREELVMMVKHVETPSRSPFSRDCPQRPWECLISTLIKFPWYMTECVTVDQRNLLYNTAISLVKNLNDRVIASPEDLNVNERLLRRVLRACFRCAGFTEAQKDGIAFTLNIDPPTCGLAIYADHWYPFSALGPKSGIPADVMLYYMALLRDATTSPAHISLGERSADADDRPPCVFGNLKFDYPKHLGSCSLAYVAKLEWTTIDRLLRRVLPGRD